MLQARADPPVRLDFDGLEVVAYSRPFEGGEASGDRFAVAPRAGRLFVLLADATGHGDRGQALWVRHASGIEAAWAELLGSPGRLADLEACAGRWNALLHPADDHLCASLAVFDGDGHLAFANFGYGNHVLPSGGAGAWWPRDPKELFGLKLGWVEPGCWQRMERAFVAHELDGVRRLVLLTDGFFPDDFRDADRTLEDVRELARSLAGLDPAAAIAAVRALPHAGDDATAVAIRVGS